MRDLLNLIDSTLTEGVGLANRKPGEKFKNSVGDVVTFQGLDFYPPSGAFKGEQMADAISELKKQGMNIHWTNTAAANSGGFGIASFTGEDGTPYYLGRFFKSISPNRAQNNFPHDAIPGEFKFQSRAGQKENTGYKPSEILTQFQSNTPETILQQIIAKFGEDSDETRATKIFMESDLPCQIPRGNMNPDAFRDYFMEMLQPVALVMGKNVGGNAAEASDIFFGPGQDYSDCVISFNANTIGGLFDSLLVNPDGKQIKLSSKGKDGANASVVNLRNSVKELAKAPKGQKLINKYSQSIAILDTIESRGHFGAPLALAIEYGIIDPGDADRVMALKEYGPTDKIIGSGLLSKKLEALWNSRKAKDPSRIIPIEHMISAIAYKVADYVNKNTDFGRAASDILNHSALVQMYTNTAVTKDTITITKLTAVYPSNTVTGVLLDASKAYMSTQGKGNFTFHILKNGATPGDVNPMDPVEKPSVDVVDYKPKRSDLKAADTATQPVKSDKETFGRRRR